MRIALCALACAAAAGSPRPALADNTGAAHGHTPQELRAAFAGLDANHDGFLEPAELMATAQEQFSMLDVNRDGKITKEEYVGGMLAAAQNNGISDLALLRRGIPAMEKTFDSKDFNKDGAWDLQEFAGDNVAALMRLDLNRDGKISIDEWLVQANPDNPMLRGMAPAPVRNPRFAQAQSAAPAQEPRKTLIDRLLDLF